MQEPYLTTSCLKNRKYILRLAAERSAPPPLDQSFCRPRGWRSAPDDCSVRPAPRPARASAGPRQALWLPATGHRRYGQQSRQDGKPKHAHSPLSMYVDARYRTGYHAGQRALSPMGMAGNAMKHRGSEVKRWVAIGMALQPFPRSKRSGHVSAHSAFRLGLWTPKAGIPM